MFFFSFYHVSLLLDQLFLCYWLWKKDEVELVLLLLWHCLKTLVKDLTVVLTCYFLHHSLNAQLKPKRFVTNTQLKVCVIEMCQCNDESNPPLDLYHLFNMVAGITPWLNPVTSFSTWEVRVPGGKCLHAAVRRGVKGCNTDRPGGNTVLTGMFACVVTHS